jgi:hypothetical protein
MRATALLIVLPKGMRMRKKTQNYGLHHQRSLTITLVSSDKKITTIQPVKSQMIVPVKDLYGKFNIRLTYSCLLLFAS